MKKILFIIDNLKGGGAENVLLTLLENIDLLDKEIDLFLINKEGVYLDRMPNYINLKYALGRSDLFVNKVIRRLLLTWPTLFYLFYIRKKYDVEIAFREDTATRILLKSSNRISQKIAWVHTDLYKHKYCKTTNIPHYIKSLSRLDKIVCVSMGCKDSLNRLNPLTVNKSIVVYNPIDVNSICSKSLSTDVIVPFLKSDINLLAIGRIDEGKNHELLIRCMPYLLKEKPVFKLWILGTGPLIGHLKLLRDSLDLHDKVEFLGFIANPYPFLKQCDLFLLSSIYEGLPTVVIEALVLKKKILSTLCIGAEEILDNGKYGMVSDFDVEHYSSSILNVLSSKFNEVSMSERINEFDLSNQMKKINQIISL